jgi:transposase-like protein
MKNIFKWRHYESEISLLCVRSYLRYALNYRDVEEMMTERGLSVVHTTIYRRVQAYAPEIEKLISSRKSVSCLHKPCPFFLDGVKSVTSRKKDPTSFSR